MKQPWWVLLIVAVLGISTGIGVGTLMGSDTSDADATADPAPDTTTVASTSAAPSTTSTTIAPSTTAPATTIAPTSSTAPSTAPPTTVPATTIPEQPPLEDVVIVVVNGAGIPGVAGTTAEVLRVVGYPIVEIADGEQIVPVTALYVAEGLEPTADQIVTDIQFIDPEFVAPTSVLPLEESPPIAPAFPEADIILYLGQDQG